MLTIKEYAEVLDYITEKFESSSTEINHIESIFNVKKQGVTYVTINVITENHLSKTNNGEYRGKELIPHIFMGDKCTKENIIKLLDNLYEGKV